MNRKLRCDHAAREPAGGGINVARAVQRLHGIVSAIFTAGGINGSRLTAMVADAGIEAHPIEIAGETPDTRNTTRWI